MKSFAGFVTRAVSFAKRANPNESRGLVRAGSVDAEAASKCLELNVPLVVSGRILDMDGVDNLDCDNLAGARTAVAELLRTGRRKIGCTGGSRALVSKQERCEGSRLASSDAGLESAATEWSDFTFAGGFESAARCLEPLSLLQGVQVSARTAQLRSAIAVRCLARSLHDLDRAGSRCLPIESP